MTLPRWPRLITHPSLPSLMAALANPEPMWRYQLGTSVVIETVAPAITLSGDPGLRAHVVVVELPHDTLHLAVITVGAGPHEGQVCDLHELCGRSHRLLDQPEVCYPDVPYRTGDRRHHAIHFHVGRVVDALGLDPAIAKVALPGCCALAPLAA